MEKPKCVVVACRLDDEAARSACIAMADARVAYVGPSVPRRMSPFPVPGSPQAPRGEGSVVATRLASGESITSVPDGLRTIPSSPQMPPGTPLGPPRITAYRQDNVPVFSATLGLPVAYADEEWGSRSPGTPARSRPGGQGGSPLPASPRTTPSNDIVGDNLAFRL